VQFSATQNKGTSIRTATLTIGGQVFTVSQSGTCTYSLSASSQTLSASGGAGSTKVTSKPTCAWTAASGASWLTVTGGSSGSGNGTVSFSADANPLSTTRTGTMTIAGQIYTVTETGETTASGHPGQPKNFRITGN
jgi:hypothetical protein